MLIQYGYWSREWKRSIDARSAGREDDPLNRDNFSSYKQCLILTRCDKHYGGRSEQVQLVS